MNGSSSERQPGDDLIALARRIASISEEIERDGRPGLDLDAVWEQVEEQLDLPPQDAGD